jgi:hypothetical protein
VFDNAPYQSQLKQIFVKSLGGWGESSPTQQVNFGDLKDIFVSLQKSNHH